MLILPEKLDTLHESRQNRSLEELALTTKWTGKSESDDFKAAVFNNPPSPSRRGFLKFCKNILFISTNRAALYGYSIELTLSDTIQAGTGAVCAK